MEIIFHELKNICSILVLCEAAVHIHSEKIITERSEL